MERVVLVAALKAGAQDRARELLEASAAGEDPPESVTDRQGVFLSDRDVIFFFEGREAGEAVRELMNDPVRSTMLAPWYPLFDGPLHAAREAYFLERSEA